MKRIDGKAVSAKVLEECRETVTELKSKGITPGLAVVLVGEDPASQVYVGSKVKTCGELGMHSEKIVLDEAAIVLAINPAKDVDGFHPENVAKLTLEDHSGFVSCTPAGCMRLLEEYGVETAGKEVVVVGRSMIVGKPMALLLLAREVCRRADILIAAVGKPEFITRAYIKPGAVVIDVGVNRVEDASKKKGFRLAGDVAFADVAEHCEAITPVPGGVGPMTISMLMKNTLKAARALG